MYSKVVAAISISINSAQGENGGVGKHASPLCTTIAKNIAILQKKYYTELSENQAVWKSKNQGFKEAVFIQTSRRGSETQRGHGD